MRKIGKAVGCCDREPRAVVQPRIEESASTVHFKVRYKAIPVGNRAPAGPGVEVQAAQTECRRDQRRARRVGSGDDVIGYSLWIERFAVENQLGVELSWSPTTQDVPYRLLSHAEQRRKGGQ